jgi:hypothetical protein
MFTAQFSWKNLSDNESFCKDIANLYKQSQHMKKKTLHRNSDMVFKLIYLWSYMEFSLFCLLQDIQITGRKTTTLSDYFFFFFRFRSQIHIKASKNKQIVCVRIIPNLTHSSNHNASHCLFKYFIRNKPKN